jgi:hypothetical protein
MGGSVHSQVGRMQEARCTRKRFGLGRNDARCATASACARFPRAAHLQVVSLEFVTLRPTRACATTPDAADLQMIGDVPGRPTSSSRYTPTALAEASARSVSPSGVRE